MNVSFDDPADYSIAGLTTAKKARLPTVALESIISDHYLEFGAISRTVHSDIQGVCRAVYKSEVVEDDGIVPWIFHFIETLQQSHRYITCFCQTELLAKTDTGTAIELFQCQYLSLSL